MARWLRQLICWVLLAAIGGISSRAEVPVPVQVGARGSLSTDSDPLDLGPVLSRISTIQCPPETELIDPPVTSALRDEHHFKVARHFRLDISAGAEVNISWLGARFTRRFMVKVEPRPVVAKLRVFVLNRPSRSIGIAEAFHRPYETRLADLWCLLKLQPGGEPGTLLTDAQPNLFFIRSSTGELNVVDAVWSGAGWEIGASPMTHNRPWPTRLRVIVR